MDKRTSSEQQLYVIGNDTTNDVVYSGTNGRTCKNVGIFNLENLPTKKRVENQYMPTVVQRQDGPTDDS